ncbi:2-dehydropantoate 2-reductase [Mesorhizobium sp. L-8-10]|uniref:ketopantoate reductase family protein n=1 Tax=Mesorhizobium sp. L-8-10 TaxID=2744523 RepID=UPI0019261757|nr:2-dehydropantoate 2-reductase [Mesorhizobium sp. L-8-10]BCH30421.1 2-dehydropantoate 2-reductase [Mesorhizobium sp. L-8-10]
MTAEPLRIAVLGAGAMGSFFGARLKSGGAAVTLIDVNRQHIDAVTANGLRVDTDAGTEIAWLPAATPDAVHDRFDVLLVFTKTMHTRSALTGAMHLIGPETVLLSLQNGLGNKEILLGFAEASRVLIGMTSYPADMIGPGHVGSHGDGKIRFWTSDGSDAPQLGTIAAAFLAGGLDCLTDDTVQVAIWEKVAFNAALNSIAAVTHATVGQIGRLPEARKLAHRIAGEVVIVANAAGIPADAKAVHDLVDHALDTHLDHKPSMLQDVLAGRRTEIDAIAGAVVRQAGVLGIPVPATEALRTLVLLATEGRA